MKEDNFCTVGEMKQRVEEIINQDLVDCVGEKYEDTKQRIENAIIHMYKELFFPFVRYNHEGFRFKFNYEYGTIYIISQNKFTEKILNSLKDKVLSHPYLLM